MAPKDPSPLGDEMAHRMPEPKFPQPQSNGEGNGEGLAGGHATAPPGEGQVESSEVEQRPSLPEHPVTMAADIEDEEADPVVDTGPGIDDGPTSLRKQRG